MTIQPRLGRKIRGNAGRFGNINNLKHSAYRNLALVDLRTGEGKELRTIAEAAVQDKGGVDSLSSLQLNLIESYAITVWRRRRLGAALLNYTVSNKPIPPNLDADFRRYCELELKLSAQIGLERQPKDVKTIQQYIQQKTMEAQAAS